MDDRCAVCLAPGMEVFYTADGIPTNSCILLATRDEAIDCPQGDMRLALCHHCGFMRNLAFESALTEYSGRYEETQGFSGTFNAFHVSLADELIARHNLHKRDVIEIGCGKGEFLWLLADRGGNRCLGFDPSYSDGRLPALTRGSLRVVRDFFGDAGVEASADFICCKMTLEHIANPRPLLAAVRRTADLRVDPIIFFQIPDTSRILTDCAFEDIYYEHCSYFTSTSLVHLFEEFGFSISRVEAVYGGQYLTLEAGIQVAPDRTRSNEVLQTHTALTRSFSSRALEKINEWRHRLDRRAESLSRVAVWGSGSKAVAFLSAVSRDSAVEYVVDINPMRRGHFMPRSGHEIVGPEDLVARPPDTVIIMNSIYRDEVLDTLDDLDLSPDVLTL